MVVANYPINSLTSPSALLERLDHFSPKFQFSMDFGEFEIRCAENSMEVQEVLELRTSIFFSPLKSVSLGVDLDIDPFDLKADHLLLIHKPSEQIVGTYRLITSLYTETFYSETEFNLKNIHDLDGIKLELGRACVAPEFRKSIAIQLLWKGMVYYARLCGARYMFGCSSVDGQLERWYPAMHRVLMDKYLTSDVMRVFPHQNLPFWMDLESKDENGFSESELNKAERMIPALLKAYLRAGAQVGGMPCWDPVFNTLDYFTLFDMNRVNESYDKRFSVQS